MKKVIIAAMLAAVSVTSWAQNNVKHTHIKPLPARVEVNNIKDAVVPAAFKVKDINLKDGKLTMTVFSEELYDAVAINKMAPGDTLYYDGHDIVMTKKIQKKNMLYINGYIEDGGANLQKCKDGTYRATQYDDHSITTRLGTVTLPVSKDVVITDCGENLTDKSTVVKTNQQKYLDGLRNSKTEFSCLNTKVTVRNGVVTAITRFWIP